VAVVETGIESQHDATNVKKHDISVVTALGMDHFDLFPDYDFYLRELLNSLSGPVISLEPLPGVDADVVVQAKYGIEDSQITLDGTQAYVTGMGQFGHGCLVCIKYGTPCSLEKLIEQLPVKNRSFHY